MYDFLDNMSIEEVERITERSQSEMNYFLDEYLSNVADEIFKTDFYYKIDNVYDQYLESINEDCLYEDCEFMFAFAEYCYIHCVGFSESELNKELEDFLKVFVPVKEDEIGKIISLGCDVEILEDLGYNVEM